MRGDDVTNNAIKMGGIVKELKDRTYTGAVRGEVMMSRSNKEKYFPDKANCRNAGNGVFKRKDGSDCDKLDIIVYDAQTLDGSNYFGTQDKMQKWLAEQGFNVAPWQMFDNPTGKECIEFINKIYEDFDIRFGKKT